MSFFDRLTESLKDIGTSIGEWTPKVIGALVILIIGWFIARIVRTIVRRLLGHQAVAGVLDKAGIGGALRTSGYDAPKLGSSIVYGFLWLVILLLAFQALGVQAIVDLLERLIAFLPQVMVAFVIVVIVAAVGSFVAGLMRPWADSRGITWLPTAVQAGFILFGVVTALDLLNIGFFTNIVTSSLLGGIGIAFAIAFGVGGIDTAKKWWAKYLSPHEG